MDSAFKDGFQNVYSFDELNKDEQGILLETVSQKYNEIQPGLTYSSTIQDENKIRDVARPMVQKDVSDSKKCCSSKTLIYASHFLSSWGDRMWMFAGGLFLLKVTPGSLRLTAIYGTVISITVILFGAAVGRWVDNTHRLSACRISLIVQNLMVCLCAGQLVFLIDYQEYFENSLFGWADFILKTGVILTASIAQLGSLGSRLCIEKDWIIVICHTESKLASMNSVLRTVDLSTEMFAPVIVGIVMTQFGFSSGAFAIASWNVTSLIIEYFLLHKIFYSEPDLRIPKNREVQVEIQATLISRLIRKIQSSIEGWKMYFKCEVRNAGLSLATLYMTILAFDNYSRGYVFEAGVSETILGILTALSSLSGISGAVLYPHLRNKIGIAKTGLFGYVFQTSMLVLCVASVFAPGTVFDPSFLTSSWSIPLNYSSAIENISNLSINESTIDDGATNINCTLSSDGNCITEKYDFTSVALLVTGIITSRCGLWISDLSITQLLQEKVPAADIGTINGVQSSLNEIMSLMRSILLIILPTVETFGFMVILSFVFVALGGCLFAIYTCNNDLRLQTKPSTNKSIYTENDKDTIDTIL